MSQRREGFERRRLATRLRILGAGALLGSLSACTLAPASNHARQVHTLYNITFVFAAVIFAVVGGAIVYAAIRFRRKPGDDELPKQVHGNSTIEIVWVTIPTLIVLVLFILSALTLGKIDSAEANSMTINVSGSQWFWKFTYPDYKTSDGTPLSIQGVSGPLHSQPGEAAAKLPTLGLELNQPVHFNLLSNDVIHSFFIPAFLFKRDVIPGHPNNFTLTPDKRGLFIGECAELCGLYHSGMLFHVEVMPKDRFNVWIHQQLVVFQRQLNACRTPQNGSLTVVAKNIQFDTKCIQVPAGPSTKIVFDNEDAGTPHNIEVFTNPSAATRVAGATGPTDVISGVSNTTYTIKALPAGTYYFRCDIHPGMNGKLLVK